MKRGQQITDPREAFNLISNRAALFHEKVVMSAAQLRTRSLGWLMEKIREGKLYVPAAPQVSEAVRRWNFYESSLKAGLSIEGLERFIINQTTGRRPAGERFPFTVVWDRI